MKETKRHFLILLSCAAVLALSPTLMFSQTYDFTTASDAHTGDGTVDATADFTVSAGQITVTLTNLEANPGAAGQLISDVSFTLSTPPVGTTYGSYSGAGVTPTGAQYINVVSKTSWSDVSSPTSDWQYTGGGGSYELTALTGGSPEQMIIGAPDSSTSEYSAANSSIFGHEPSIQGSATFTFDITGVTAATQISSAAFSFGTGPDMCTDCGGVPVPNVSAPEGGSAFLYLLLAGTCCFGAALFKSQRRAFL